MNLALPAFRRGLPATQVDRSLRSALTAFDAARQCALVWFHEILSRRLYLDLGFASMEQYASESLGFSRNRTNQFLRLARDLDRLPPLKDAVLDGRLEWTKAQQVGRVATPETAGQWVDLAARSSRRELLQGIKIARRAATQERSGQGALALAVGEAGPGAGAPTAQRIAPPPAPRVSVSLLFDSLDAARLEALIEAAKKSGVIAATATREEAILAALAVLVEGERQAKAAGGGGANGEAKTVRRRTAAAAPYRVVLYRCRACEATEVVTSTGRRPVDRASAAAAVENAVVHDAGRNRSVIPPGLREKVLARDRHCCQAAGCNRTRFLEVHHKIPRALGGSNKLENLTTLCSRCHRFVHRRSPTGVERERKEMPATRADL
jgi:5-methylcytosine-specific restriction endonuclease McrA